MKIEVAIEGREPYGHSLTKERTIIGSGDECDLVLKIKGISRKHAVVINENEQFFIIDQGSAEGTYINEEQLVPGQKAEFTSFFPVKLGPYITLSLASEETLTDTFEFAKDLPSEPTRSESRPSRTEAVISSPSAAKPKTIIKSDVPKRSIGIEGREGLHTRKRSRPIKATAEPLSQDAKRMRTTKVFAFLVVAGGVAFFYFNKEGPVTGEVKSAEDLVAEKVIEVPERKIKDLKLNLIKPPISSVNVLFNEGLCNTSNDYEICKIFGLPVPGLSKSGFGVKQDYIQLMIPNISGNELWDSVSARINIMKNIPHDWSSSIDDRDVIAVYLFSLYESNWKFLAEGKTWIYASVLSPIGTVEKIYFADVQATKQALEYVLPGFNTTFTGSIEQFWPISGNFRELTFEQDNNLESL